MPVLTTTLPDDLHLLLKEKAKLMSLPKNKLIEKALRIYFEHLNRAEYIRSYKRLGDDKDLMKIAEEGMEDYFRQIEKE